MLIQARQPIFEFDGTKGATTTSNRELLLGIKRNQSNFAAPWLWTKRHLATGSLSFLFEFSKIPKKSSPVFYWSVRKKLRNFDRSQDKEVAHFTTANICVCQTAIYEISWPFHLDPVWFSLLFGKKSNSMDVWFSSYNCWFSTWSRMNVLCFEWPWELF